MKIRSYTVKTEKLPDGNAIGLLFVSDLHGRAAERGPEILSVLREKRPAAFLLGGDQISTNGTEKTAEVADLFRKAAAICPVFTVDGNHETRLRERKDRLPEWETIEQCFSDAGVTALHNRTVKLQGSPGIRISGFEAPLASYRKFRRPYLAPDAVTEALGTRDSHFTILLAHNPAFAEHYFSYGADLILAGHYHGGLVRFGQTVLVSPYGFPFPRYGYGRYDEDGKTLLVSAGAGDHCLPLRIGDPYEMLWIEIEGAGHGDQR